MRSSVSSSETVRSLPLPFTLCERTGEASGEDRREREGDRFETTRNG